MAPLQPCDGEDGEVMARRRRDREINFLGHGSFLDTMANTVGALAFILFIVVIVTVTLKLNYLPIRITTETLPDAVIGRPYDVSLAGIGGNEPYEWTLVDGTLPDGLSFIVRDETVQDATRRAAVIRAGSIVGTPKGIGDAPFTVRFRLDDTPVAQEKGNAIDMPPVEKVFDLRVLPAPFDPLALEVRTQDLPTGIIAQPYSVDLSAVGGVPPYAWTAEGAMPQGMSVDSAGGRMFGTPAAEGERSLVIRVEDRRGTEASATLTFRAARYRTEQEIIAGLVRPLALMTEKIPDAVANRAYDLSLAASGGIPPYQWSLKGTLPAGLALTQDGRLVGTPRAAADSTKLTIAVANAADAAVQGSATRDVTLTVLPSPVPVPPLRMFPN